MNRLPKSVDGKREKKDTKSNAFANRRCDVRRIENIRKGKIKMCRSFLAANNHSSGSARSARNHLSKFGSAAHVFSTFSKHDCNLPISLLLILIRRQFPCAAIMFIHETCEMKSKKKIDRVSSKKKLIFMFSNVSNQIIECSNQ